MPKECHPRRGSMGYYPRKRSKRIYPTIKSRVSSKEAKIVEFAGYKVGMTHVGVIDDKKGSVTKNQEITISVTVLETPPLKVVGVRGYTRDIKGLKTVMDIWAKDIDKDLNRKMNPSKKVTDLENLEKKINEIHDVALLVHTVPRSSGIKKKKPELFEILIIGENVNDKLNIAKEKLGKEIKVGEIFKEGDFVDTVAITKGKGRQGSIKRFGVKLGDRKTDKTRRAVGTLGPWHPAKIRPTVPQAGQMGYHKRTELNKRILKIGDKPAEVNVKGGWLEYGVVRNDYVLIKGSVQGHRKRLIRLRSAIRPPKEKYGTPEIVNVSLSSKQGI